MLVAIEGSPSKLLIVRGVKNRAHLFAFGSNNQFKPSVLIQIFYLFELLC